ncbi:Penicillin-binding protein 2D [compost metagenome]
MYLNSAEWGNGVFGAEAAARRHFGKGAAQLSRQQASLLAAVLPNPREWSAGRPSGYVQQRAGWIRRQMAQLGDGYYLRRL